MNVDPSDPVEEGAGMMEVPALDALRARLRELEGALESVDPADFTERERLRGEILLLFRDTEALIEEAARLKEGVRPLVERYRELFPRGDDERAGPPRVDHLGNATYQERGWSALAGGDDERAVRELRRARSLAPEEPRTRVLLAWALARLAQEEEAEALVQEVVHADPEHPLGLTVLGYLRLEQRRFAEAIESLSGALRSGTDRTASLYANLYLGRAYAERDMHRDAETFFRRALELGPNLTEAYWELGRSHFREGRPDLAMAAWNAGGSNPFNPWGERCREAAERLAARGGAAPP